MRRICIGPRYRILSLGTCAAPRASIDLDLKWTRTGKGILYILSRVLLYSTVEFSILVCRCLSSFLICSFSRQCEDRDMVLEIHRGRYSIIHKLNPRLTRRRWCTLQRNDHANLPYLSYTSASRSIKGLRKLTFRNLSNLLSRPEAC